MPKAFRPGCQKLRVEVNILLRRAKPPKSNISREEKKALKELREDQDRMVLTADKGVALVVMDRKEYQEKNRRLTGNTGLQGYHYKSNQQIEGTTHPEVQKTKKGS